MAQNTKKPLIWIISAVVVIAILAGIAVAVFGGNDEDTEQQNTAPTHSGSSPSTPAPGQDTPGAQLDSQQRSWPDPAGLFDDSQWATPGQYSVEPFHSRPVFTPNNHDGDLPGKGDLVASMDSCTQEPVMLTGKTQMQYVNARFLTVNDKAGPTTMDNDVPGGYAHSPQGAITAALNQLSYGMFGQGDEVGEEIDKKLWSSSKTVQEELSSRLPAGERNLTSSRPDSTPAPSGYKVLTCSDNIVVVDVFIEQPDNPYESEGDFAVRVPLAWRGGDWTPDFSGAGDADIKAARSASPDDFTEVDYR